MMRFAFAIIFVTLVMFEDVECRYLLVGIEDNSQTRSPMAPMTTSMPPFQPTTFFKSGCALPKQDNSCWLTGQNVTYLDDKSGECRTHIFNGCKNNGHVSVLVDPSECSNLNDGCTPCQVHRDSETARQFPYLFSFVPECKESGHYQAKQRLGSTGYSFCYDKNGNKVESSDTPPAQKLDCSIHVDEDGSRLECKSDGQCKEGEYCIRNKCKPRFEKPLNGKQCVSGKRAECPGDICNSGFCSKECATGSCTKALCHVQTKGENQLCYIESNNCDKGLKCMKQVDGCNNGIGRCVKSGYKPREYEQGGSYNDGKQDENYNPWDRYH